MRIIILLILLTFTSNLFAQNSDCSSTITGVIFCDDFDNNLPLASKYFEYNSNNNDFIVMDSVGRNGSKGMRVLWQKGEVGAGGLSKSFGKTPNTYIGKNAVMKDSSFKEIYWHLDVRHQKGWTGGGPDKLTRALVLANSNWATGMMAHLWSGGKNNVYLGMDPASGVTVDGTLKTTKYNDFDNLRWLGFKVGSIDMFSTENSGRWFCVEGHVKLNTPGANDGVFEFWVNDTLQAGSYNLNWHSTWNNDKNNMNINAIFFENYWNNGSSVQQERYIDNLLISTKPIGSHETPLFIEEVKKEKELEIYPSQANNGIIIFNPQSLAIDKVEVYDMNGKSYSIERQVDLLDISSLSKGRYFVKIILYNGKEINSSFIKVN